MNRTNTVFFLRLIQLEAVPDRASERGARIEARNLGPVHQCRQELVAEASLLHPAAARLGIFFCIFLYSSAILVLSDSQFSYAYRYPILLRTPPYSFKLRGVASALFLPMSVLTMATAKLDVGAEYTPYQSGWREI